MHDETARMIRDALETAFHPVELEVTDESWKHAAHAGHRAHGGGHFSVRIRAACFAGISRVQRHRMVHAALGDAFRDRIHALSIAALAPGEA